MTFDFYTQNSKYTIGETSVLKDGEMIGKGTVFLFQVLLGCPGILIISENDKHSPKIIKTTRVTSILPEYEFFDGEQCPQKLTYEFKFTAKERKRVYHVLAVDETHASILFSNLIDNPDIVSVKPLKRTVKLTSRGYQVC